MGAKVGDCPRVSSPHVVTRDSLAGPGPGSRHVRRDQAREG